MKKSELRKKYKKLRDNLSSEEIYCYSKSIFQNLLNLNIWDKKYFHIFLTIKNKKEIDTSLITKELWKINKLVSASVSNFENNTLENYRYTKETKVEINSWGIPEPKDADKINDKEIDVVFVPLLAFDKQGYRVGYGKGFYDRFLANCKTDIIKVGVSFFEIEDVIEDVHSDDIKLDFCVTPKNIYKF